MNDAIIVKNVTRRFGKDTALDHVNLVFPSQGIIGILGHSGSGKSTLLQILSGLDEGYEGSVRILGKRWEKMSKEARSRFRLENIGFVFQSFSLLELETALGNVMLPLDALSSASKEDQKRKALDLLRCFGVEGKANQRVNTLSGGEKQRVALARALANDPKILFADEPTGALDEANSIEVFSLLRAASASSLVIVVTHDSELAHRFCDKVIVLQDGKVIQSEEIKQESLPLPRPNSLTLGKRKKRPSLSSFFLIRHAFAVIKAKKWRSLLSEASISIGLSGLGLAMYVSTSISDEISNAFSSLVPPSTVVMAPRSKGEPTIGNVYSESFEVCEYIKEEYAEMVYDYGSTLYMNYEEWFHDENYFSYSTGAETVVLPDFSIRHINDFQWLDLVSEKYVYPRRPVIMGFQDVVLGLPYEHMFTTCLSMHITRNYQSLGDYIDTHGWNIFLYLAAYDWGFADEEVFDVIGVVESPYPCLYHLDHLWNHHWIIDRLHFHSSLSDDTPFQSVYEIPFLSLRCHLSEFLYLARKDDYLESLVYEKASSDYLPTQCPAGKPCNSERIYLYGADKSGISWNVLDECMEKCPQIKGRNIISSSGYYADTDSLMMGFSGRFFLCKDESLCLEMIDSYSDLPLASASLRGEMPFGVKEGSYFSSASKGLRLSTDVTSFLSGNAPSSIEECILSSSLYEAWGHPSELFVAYETGAEEVGSMLSRTFASGSLKVTGVKQEDYDTLYVTSDWTVDYLLEVLGVSSFGLEPYGAVFSVGSKEEGEEVISKLSKEYPSYAFSNPAMEIASSLDSTLGYIGTVLTAFSSVALSVSSLLFIIVMTITVNETKGEARLLFVLGISRGDIARNYQAHCFLYTLSSCLTSSLMLLVSEFAAKYYIASTFSSPLQGGLPLFPIGAIGVASLTFFFLSSLCIEAFARSKGRF